MPTFLLADLAGFTALTEAHGDERAADEADEFGRLVREMLARHEAEEVNAMGDALLIRVPDAAEAIRLAASIAAEAGARHERLGVRIGMHTGSAVQRGTDWYGAAVNVTSRVADAAGSGEVLLTAATVNAAGAAIDRARLAGRGTQRFKNVHEPVELFALEVADAASGRLVVDPVCKMAVDPALAAASIEAHGDRYYFCSTVCADTFAASDGAG